MRTSCGLYVLFRFLSAAFFDRWGFRVELEVTKPLFELGDVVSLSLARRSERIPRHSILGFIGIFKRHMWCAPEALTRSPTNI
jgi:hypothetical protein